jgi:predicted adenine nucleotide alpha hydrolase (AANH) superfamily ATPase
MNPAISPSTGNIGLHLCCAPCLSGTLATLRAGGGIPAPGELFFFNPNIHPLIEFRRRVKALRIYLERNRLEAEIDDEYGLESWLEAMLADGGLPKNRRDRCRRCYLLRLSRAAERFKARGREAFTTTLLASREQSRELVLDAGREVADRFGLEFLPADFSRAGPAEGELKGIYRQQYCGCVFSEEERYRHTGRHLYPPPGARADGLG